MYMSSYLLPFLDTGIDDICIYLSILTDIPYLDGEKLSMKTFFIVVCLRVTNHNKKKYKYTMYMISCHQNSNTDRVLET